MQEVFTLKDGEYNKSNAFWDSHSMMGMIAELPKDQQGAYIARAQAISDQYDQLSTQYQDTKSDNDIPLN